MDAALAKQIGTRLKKFRLEHNMTQQDFADIFGMSKIWVHSVEKGRHMFPLECMVILKDRFGLTYDYLIDGIKNSSDELADAKIRMAELTRMNSFLEEHIELLKGASLGKR